MEIRNETLDMTLWTVKNNNPKEIALSYLRAERIRILESMEYLNSGLVGNPSEELLNNKTTELTKIETSMHNLGGHEGHTYIAPITSESECIDCGHPFKKTMN